MLEKEIIALGDIEMGAGNLTDDFISDNALSELIEELGRRPHPVDLVLNGDTFDFLRAPYFKENQLVYPRHITEEISLAKLRLIYHAHYKVFEALKKFTKIKRHRLFFVIGNHDYDLVYRKVQKKIKTLLGNHKNIYFLRRYRHYGVYIEHGQQYDFLNRINFNKLFLNYKRESILNLSWVSFGLISTFMHLKEEHPFIERVFPRPTLLSLHRSVVKKLTFKTAVYFLKSIIYFPFRYYFDPTYTYPKELFREFYRRVRKVNWDVDNIIQIFKHRKKRTLKKNKIYILGHIHEKYIEEKKGKVIIHPGSWRDEYNLDPKTKKLTPRPKRYVQILVSKEGELNYQIIEQSIRKKQLDYNEVVKDEVKFVKLAAKEEGFTPALI